MPLPSILDVARTHLFDDRDALVAAGMHPATIGHLLRIRDVYSYWLNFPLKRDKEIVALVRRKYDLSDTQARTDLRLVKTLLGDFQQSTKDYHRFRAFSMIEDSFHAAKAAGNTRDMVAAADKYAKYAKLDKEDERDVDWGELKLLNLEFTDDPAVIGISRMPDHRKKIRALKEKYWNDNVVDVLPENVEFNVDDLFDVNKDGE